MIGEQEEGGGGRGREGSKKKVEFLLKKGRGEPKLQNENILVQIINFEETVKLLEIVIKIKDQK